MNVSSALNSGARPIVQVFCRPYLIDDFRANFEPLADRFDFRYLCDGSKPGTDDTRADFYSHWHSRSLCASLSEAEIDDALKRCRLLRNIDREAALRMLHAMALTLEGVLDANRPEVIICQMVDEYVTHLLSVLAKKRGVLYLGYIYSYFPGYVQVILSSMGAGFDVREPSDEEASLIVAKYSEGQFRRDYDQKPRGTLARQIKAMLRYRVKLAYFWAKGHWERDPLNLHYMQTPYIAEYRHLRDLPSPSMFDSDWSAKIAAAKAAERTVVFIPLGYFPESTIDFWVRNTSIIDYMNKSVEMTQALASRFVVVVKEHPHMVGARNVEFYRRLAAIEGVIMVPPDAYATEVMGAADAVVLGSGSAGVEARLRNKPVFSYCDSSYWFKASGAAYIDLDAIQTWPQTIAAALEAGTQRPTEGRHEFAKACLRSTTRQRPGSGRWPLCQIDDLETALRIGISKARRPAHPTQHPLKGLSE